MTAEEIRGALFAMRDAEYAAFQAKLLPTRAPETLIGVRTPALRKLAKALSKEDHSAFLHMLPHTYFDEDQLHAFLVSELRDFDTCLAETERFLPYIDNWATCDQFSPKVFAKHTDDLLPEIRRWLQSPHTYTVRFAAGMLMRYFLDDRFQPEYAEWVAALRSEEYYVQMMQAWYFATALAKQYDAVIGYLTERRLPLRVHNMTIQKAVESFRITPEQKAYLRTLRRKEE